jgi:ATP-dependent RNA helicase DHX57
MSALREVQNIRVDLANSLSEMGFLPRDIANAAHDAHADLEEWDANSSNKNLVKAVISAGLWPSLIRVAPPSARYDQGISGTIQRDHEAKSVKFFDAHGSLGRVFIHPGSTMFSAANFKSHYLSSFQKSSTGDNVKVYLRDANEAPLMGLLLLAAGEIKFDHSRGGLEIKAAPSITEQQQGRTVVRMRADARIGILGSQLRRLLDAVLDDAIEQPGRLLSPNSQEVLHTVASVLQQ